MFIIGTFQQGFLQMERHLNKKARRASGKNHLKGPRKRTAEDDEHFRASFEKMIYMAMEKEK